MGKALKIRDELSAESLRGEARRETDGRAAARMYAIAHALEGLSRAEAARLAGMERQALRDAVVRYNAEGLAGLHDRPKGRPRRRLDANEEAGGPGLPPLVAAGRAPAGVQQLGYLWALAIVLEPCVDGSRGARALFGRWVWSVAAMCTASDVQRGSCAP